MSEISEVNLKWKSLTVQLRDDFTSALKPSICNMMQFDQSNLSNYMSNTTGHNNDLSIPEGVTFVGSINVPGVAQINGDITGQITCKQLEVGPKGNIKGQI